MARRRRSLQADVSRRRVGDPRPALHGDRLHRHLRTLRRLPGRRHEVPDPRARGRAPDAVLRLRAHGLEHEPRREPQSRHEGLLPANPAPACGRPRPTRRLPRRHPRADGVHGDLRRVAGWARGPRRSVVHGTRRRHRARPRPVPLGHERALPRRALHDPGLPAGPPASLRRHVRRAVDRGEVAVGARVQPHDRRRLRVALGRDRRATARCRADGVGRCRRDFLFLVGLGVFRSSEPRFADTI